MRNIDAFSSRILDAENDVARDESKLQSDDARDESRLQRDESKLASFGERLGVPEQQGPMLNFGLSESLGASPADISSKLERTADYASTATKPASQGLADALGRDLRSIADVPYQAIGRAVSGAIGPGLNAPVYNQADVQAGRVLPNGAPVPTPAPTGQPAQEPAPTLGPAHQALSRPSVVPAHWDASRIPFKPGTRGAMMRDEKDAAAAEQSMLAAERRQNMIVGNNMAKAADDAQDELIHRQMRDDERNKYVADKRAVLEKRLNEIPQEDPNRVFNNADTGTKVMLGIGAFFGGLIPGVKPLMNMLGGNIEQDIESQRQNIKGKQWKADQARVALNDVVGDQHDQRQQEVADELSRWKIADSYIKAQMARTSDPILKARGEEALAASDARQTGLRGQFDRMSHVQATVKGGVGATSKTNPLAIHLPGGQVRIASTEPEAAKMRAKLGLLEKQRVMDERALKIRNEIAANPLSSDNVAKYKELQGLVDDSTAMNSAATEQGVLKEAEFERAKDHAANYTSMNPVTFGATNKAITATGTRRDKAAEAELNAVAPEGGVTGHTVDANGRIQPVTEYNGTTSAPIRRPKSGQAK